MVLLATSLLAWLAWMWVDVPAVLGWARSLHGPVPALILVPLQTAVSLAFSPIPSDVVGVALCVVYGFTRGSFLVWLAWMLGAWIEYALVRRIASHEDVGAARRRLPRWLRRLPVDHPAFLICARWFPLGPHLVNSAAGAAGVPLWRYTWTAATGIAPVALLIGAVSTGLLAAGGPARPSRDAEGDVRLAPALYSDEFATEMRRTPVSDRGRATGSRAPLGECAIDSRRLRPAYLGRSCVSSSTTAESRIWASDTACRC